MSGSASRNMIPDNLGTITVSGTNTGAWYLPAAPGVKSGTNGNVLQPPGLGLTGETASLQINITGPLAGTFFLDGSVDGINFPSAVTPLGITLPLITDAHQNVTAKTDGVVTLYTKIPVFTSIATKAVSSTVGQLTVLASSIPAGLVGVVAGDAIDITSGADSGTYTILGVTGVTSGNPYPPSAGGSATVITYTITFTTATSLAGSTAATALIYSGSTANFSSASGAFLTNNVVAGDVVNITAGVLGGSFFPVVSGITASTLTMGTPNGLTTAGVSQHFTVSTNAPYPNAYTINLTDFGYPYLKFGIVASGLYGSAQAWAAVK